MLSLAKNKNNGGLKLWKRQCKSKRALIDDSSSPCMAKHTHHAIFRNRSQLHRVHVKTTYGETLFIYAMVTKPFEFSEIFKSNFNISVKIQMTTYFGTIHVAKPSSSTMGVKPSSPIISFMH
jgi:hypothetical protein